MFLLTLKQKFKLRRREHLTNSNKIKTTQSVLSLKTLLLKIIRHLLKSLKDQILNLIQLRKETSCSKINEALSCLDY